MRQIIILVAIVAFTKQEGCIIDINSLRTDVPLFLDFTNLQVIYPSMDNSEGNRNISIPKATTIVVSCPKNIFLSSNLSTSTIYATCNENSEFESLDQIVTPLQMRCRNYDPITTRDLGSYGNSSILVEVGLPLGVDIKLVSKILICFDTIAKIPIYTRHNLTKSIGFMTSYLDGFYFEDLPYYCFSGEYIEYFYDINEQMRNINSLLGLPESSTKFINPTFTLEMTQFSSRSFFVYLLEQYAAYRYINTAPVWGIIFEYNWFRLEADVIDYVQSYKSDLQIYTGTYGVSTLPHEDSNEKIELYLASENKFFPVAKLIWKIVYDPAKLKAVVFVTVNNPYRLNEDEVICEDISDVYGWLTWDKANVTRGYSYACTYEEAKLGIPVIPELLIQDVLF